MTFTNSNSARLNLEAEVPYLQFPVLSEIPFIRHGFSTRLGGVSSGIYSSMNLGSDSAIDGDTPEHIRTNFELICGSMKINPKSLVISKQVHKTNIRLVEEKDKGKGLYVPRDYDEIDGLITDQPGITLVTKYADCVPLFLVDTKRKAIGLSHSGWRGTVSKIGLITIQEMKKQFGSEPKDIIAVIGPSICQDCYEVSVEVAEKFEDAFSLNGNNMNNILRPNSSGRYQLDLWEANKAVFIEAGLRQDQIHVSGVCTACHSDLLFSHRKTGGKRGSLAAFLAINNE